MLSQQLDATLSRSMASALSWLPLLPLAESTHSWQFSKSAVIDTVVQTTVSGAVLLSPELSTDMLETLDNILPLITEVSGISSPLELTCFLGINQPG